MQNGIEDASAEVQTALARLRAFCFPGGEEAAHRIRAIKTTERGQMRMSPDARWIPFTAEQIIESTHSSFRWVARLDPGKLGSPTVTDSYEDGHGRLTVKLGGVFQVKKIEGPEADRGELQRYLGSIVYCPPIILNHPSVKWTEVAPLTLRVCDGDDPTGASVDFEVCGDGCPLGCRAERPRVVGKQSILTPWSASCAGFKEWEGLRVPNYLEVNWHLPEGLFTYFQSEITSFTAIR